jgi:hypothetical protein
MRMLVGCRAVDKLDVAAAIQEEQGRSGLLERLYKHSYKLSVTYCLEIMFTLDFVEPLVTITLDFKKHIVEHVFAVVAAYLNKGTEPERT